MRNEKGSVPLRYWLLWWSILVVADVVFYVLLTPIWLGLRGLAWLAEFRARRRHRGQVRGVSPPGPTR